MLFLLSIFKLISLFIVFFLLFIINYLLIKSTNRFVACCCCILYIQIIWLPTLQGRSQDFSKGGHTVSNIIVMACSPRNIVDCLLKKDLQRGGGVTGTPGPPLATPLLSHIIRKSHACRSTLHTQQFLMPHLYI